MNPLLKFAVAMACLVVSLGGGIAHAQSWITSTSGPEGVLFRATSIKESASLDGFDAGGTVDSTSEFTGHYADQLWTLLGNASAAERRKLLLERWLPRYPMAQFAQDPVITRDAGSRTVTLVERVRLTRLGVKMGDGWRLDYTPANLVLALPGASELALAPASAPLPGSQWRYTYEVTLPKDIQIQRPTLQRRLAGNFFEWEVTSQFKGNIASDTHQLKWLAAPGNDAERQRFAQDMAALDRQRRDVYISRSMINGSSLAEQQKQIAEQGAGFEQRVRPAMELRFNQAARLLQQNVPASERLDLLLYRGESAMTLGRLDVSLADANEALRLLPNNPRGLRLRGMGLLLRGEFEAAGQAFALGLRAPDVRRIPELMPELQYRRGQALLMANRPAEAVAELQAALASVAQMTAETAAINANAAEPRLASRVHYMRVWLLAALQQQGAVAGEEIRRNFSSQATGAWPEPLVGLFLGQVSPEALPLLADELPGDVRLMGHCEGQFFVGLKAWLPAGNAGRTDAARTAAKAAFENAVRTRAFPLFEYRLAETLLKTL